MAKLLTIPFKPIYFEDHGEEFYQVRGYTVYNILNRIDLAGFDVDKDFHMSNFIADLAQTILNTDNVKGLDKCMNAFIENVTPRNPEDKNRADVLALFSMVLSIVVEEITEEIDDKVSIIVPYWDEQFPITDSIREEIKEKFKIELPGTSRARQNKLSKLFFDLFTGLEELVAEGVTINLEEFQQGLDEVIEKLSEAVDSDDNDDDDDEVEDSRTRKPAVTKKKVKKVAKKA